MFLRKTKNVKTGIFLVKKHRQKFPGQKFDTENVSLNYGPLNLLFRFTNS